jgi:septal ring factor EnvC (AmiA/AmiB activator)
MRGKATYSNTWIATAVRSVLYASALSAGVLLCAAPAQADDRDQLKSIQADIAAKQRAIKQQQQQRASLLAQLKAQEEAISAAARKLRETQDTLNQLNKQIDEMNASIAKLERQRATQERNLSAQLDAAFRQGPHTGMQMILSGEEGQRNQRMQVYYGYLNQARQETIAQLKQTREEVAAQKAELEESRANSRRWFTSSAHSRQNWNRRGTNVRKPFQALNRLFSKVSSSWAKCGPTNRACAVGSRKQKPQRRPAQSEKLARLRPCAIVSRMHPVKVPPTNRPKASVR